MYVQFRMSKFPFFPYETKSYMNEPAMRKVLAHSMGRDATHEDDED